MLLWRQATPWLAVSASSRKVVAATPPTPGVLQTGAMGGNGPGWSGHCALPVHCALVSEQLPGTLAHGTCELHAAWVLAQVPIDEQSLEPRHSTVASLAQVPMI